MRSIQYKNEKLHIENIPLEQIADAFGTPVYCYSTQQITHNFEAWNKALKKSLPENNFTICYACKANSNLAILYLLQNLGAGADIVSFGEMQRAIKAGISPSKIVFSGVGKTREELTAAIQKDLMLINIESESELFLISEISQKENKITPISFRINPNIDAKTHPKITTGMEENKFGIDINEAPALYKKASELPNVNPTGVSIHIGSQLLELLPFEDAFKSLASLVKTLKKEGHDITLIDLGGGVGITYKDETPPDLNEYAELVKKYIHPLGAHIILEPGRSIVGNAGLLLTRILHTKENTKKKFLIIDASMSDLMRPALYDAHHTIIPYKEHPKEGEHSTFDVVGPICETSDTFLVDTKLPDTLSSGELISIMDTGAYGAVMASNYNTRPFAAEVLIKDDKFSLIRKTETIKDLINKDIIPDWST